MSKNSPSKRKYKEALKTAEDHAYKGLPYNPPKHFDERQIRLYTEKYSYHKNIAAHFEEENEMMANIHGYTYVKDDDGKFVIKKLEERGEDY